MTSKFLFGEQLLPLLHSVRIRCLGLWRVTTTSVIKRMSSIILAAVIAPPADSNGLGSHSFVMRQQS